MMDELVMVLQITIAVVIIAVWIFRPRLETVSVQEMQRILLKNLQYMGQSGRYTLSVNKIDSCKSTDFGYLVLRWYNMLR